MGHHGTPLDGHVSDAQVIEALKKVLSKDNHDSERWVKLLGSGEQTWGSHMVPLVPYFHIRGDRTLIDWLLDGSWTITRPWHGVPAIYKEGFHTSW